MRAADASDHLWSKPLFLAIMVIFVFGGFFVTILPGPDYLGQGASILVHAGYANQMASVIAMAVLQLIKGRTLRAAMRAVLQ